MNTKQRIEALEKRIAYLESLIQGAPVPIHVNGDKVKAIKRLIEQHFGVKPKLLWSKCREPHIVWPRQIGMHLALKYSGRRAAELDRYFNHSSHSVAHARDTVKDRRETEPTWETVIASLELATRELLGVNSPS